MNHSLHQYIGGLSACVLVLTLSAPVAHAQRPGGPPPPPPRTAGSGGTSVVSNGIPQVQLLDEFRPIGATGNNLEHPNLDPVPNTAEIAIAPLNFASGTDDGMIDGPNARTISNVIAGGTGAQGQNSETVDPHASAWLYVFGQFVDHDIDLEDTPTTTADCSITVPDGDPVFTPGTLIQMNRDARDASTNTIINTTAGYLDLSQLYGSSIDVAMSLRNSDGKLQSSDNGLYLPVEDEQFITGDPRVMENPELSALTIMFMREHNRWVDVLKAQHSTWTGDQLYDMAKAITTAEYQNIIYTEYLPVLLGPVLGPYRGYDANTNAQVTQEFSTAAFRMGHSEVSDTQEGLDNQGNTTFTQSLAEAFFNTPEIDEANGVDALLRSLGVDNSQATDVYTVAALRNLLFAPLVGGDVDEMDLIAIDIQRERDAGLGSLNQTREALGMKPYKSFADLTSDSVLQQSFANVYGTIDNVDLFMGGLAEKHAPGAQVGQTFQAIIAGQFDVLRDGDRFFWLNQNFDKQTAAYIAQTTLADIVKRNTDTTATLQPNLFLQANLNAPHQKPHAPMPDKVDSHGKTKPFVNDGV